MLTDRGQRNICLGIKGETVQNVVGQDEPARPLAGYF